MITEREKLLNHIDKHTKQKYRACPECFGPLVIGKVIEIEDKVFVCLECGSMYTEDYLALMKQVALAERIKNDEKERKRKTT